MLQIMLLTLSGHVQIDYKEEIKQGRSVNDIFATFLEKGDDVLSVVLRTGDHIVINKLPKENSI